MGKKTSQRYCGCHHASLSALSVSCISQLFFCEIFCHNFDRLSQPDLVLSLCFPREKWPGIAKTVLSDAQIRVKRQRYGPRFCPRRACWLIFEFRAVSELPSDEFPLGSLSFSVDMEDIGDLTAYHRVRLCALDRKSVV